MKKKNTLLNTALAQLANLYQAELLIRDFLKVLQHYASSDDLKWQIFGQRHQVEARNKRLRVLLASFDHQKNSASGEEVHGILRHGLKMIKQFPHDEDKDLPVIHVLMLVHHYMRSAYSILGSYFLKCGYPMEAKQVQKYAREEESAIEEDMRVHEAILLD